MKKLWMLIAFSGLLPLMAVNVYMAGDSTMARYPASYQYQKGWGQVLQEYAVDGVKVFNMAVGGRSSKSFRSEGRWAKICDALQPGDFVFIQFGHNDGQPGEKNLYRFADPEKAYPENLRQFIREVRAKKATPVLCTSIVWSIFKNGKLAQPVRLEKYCEAARRVAAEEKVDFIDVNALAKAEINKLGMENTRKLYMHLKPGVSKRFPNGRSDDVHLQTAGAHFYASLIIKAAKEQKLPVGEIFNTTPKTNK